MGKSQELYKKAKTIIPGGTQLLSKRPEMLLPELWPAYYEKAKGCEVWDLDGNKYYDFSYMSLGACILGYADDEINNAVKEVIENGSITTLNPPEEVKLAELLIEIHPWADMVRYARAGGEAMSIAIRIARAYSKRDIIMFCGYHGWHDWYLASNLADDKALDGHLLPGLLPAGVPRSLKGVAVPFNYNNTKEFLEKFNKIKNNVGAIVLETIRNDEPEKEFLSTIRNETSMNKIPLIVDEITAGWRLNVGGSHLIYNLTPDIAVFAKGISNGFPMAAVIGKGDIMQSAQESFISSTYWTDRIGPVAAIATIKKMKDLNVPEYIISVGKKIKSYWQKCADKYNIKIHISGIDPLAHFSFNYNNPLELKTLFTQLMLEKGFLSSTALYSSLAHTEDLIEKYFTSVDSTFEEISKHIANGTVKQALKGPVCHSGFRRLN